MEDLVVVFKTCLEQAQIPVMQHRFEILASKLILELITEQLSHFAPHYASKRYNYEL